MPDNISKDQSYEKPDGKEFLWTNTGCNLHIAMTKKNIGRGKYRKFYVHYMGFLNTLAIYFTNNMTTYLLIINFLIAISNIFHLLFTRELSPTKFPFTSKHGITLPINKENQAQNPTRSLPKYYQRRIWCVCFPYILRMATHNIRRRYAEDM